MEEIKENDAINKTALIVSEGRLSALKFYGSDQEPLVELGSLLEVLSDVPKEILINALTKDEYMVVNNKVYLKDSGWYAALCMTKLEIGQFFRAFIKNLLRKLWETNPALLIQAAEETKEELAKLRVRYREQRNEHLEAQGRINELTLSVEAQERRSVRVISMLKTARTPEQSDRSEEFEAMCKMFLQPYYIFMVPQPKLASDASDADEDEDYTLYDIEVEPDPDLVSYYSVTKSDKRKSDSSLIKTVYSAPKSLAHIKHDLETYCVNSRVYRCSLSTICDIIEKYRLDFIKGKAASDDEVKPKKGNRRGKSKSKSRSKSKNSSASDSD